MGADLYAGLQSVLDPRGPQAARIDDLWWLFLIVSVIVWIGVAAALALAIRRPGRAPDDLPRGEPGKVRTVAIATGATVAVLFGFVVASVVAGRAMSMPPPDEGGRPLIVDVIGRQWWWEIRYDDPTPSRSFRTANELRMPVGRPVVIRATSRDVIHSFWVPNLHGKIDLVPGRTNTIWLSADTPGEYRGQCAEFCGVQHAKMGLVAVVEREADFEAWAERQRAPAAPPADAPARRGEEVFLSAQCSLCHAVRGTTAMGLVAPDLTHLASRRTLAAGVLRNTRGNLAGWIADPQNVKPGNHMPPTHLAPDDLHALLSYLESLK